MSIPALLNEWRNDPEVAPNIAAWRTFPERQRTAVPFPAGLHPLLKRALLRRGIDVLYTHQGQALEHILAGRHTVIATGTASGKTLCYNLPVLNRLLVDPSARALYIFPTKALAQDQKDELRGFIGGFEEGSEEGNPQQRIPVSTYDGDTPKGARTRIRRNARLVISNPDMLHSGILPHHTLWSEFFRHLHFVVIDEIHVHRGVFGSHVANVLRRLKRIADFYGSAPRFILTSATIANPGEHAERLVEDHVSLVEVDGAPRGERHLLIYNPPIVNRELGLRRSALLESVRLARDLYKHDVQTIVFGRTRRTVELILGYLRGTPTPSAHGDDEDDRIRGYRSGYLVKHRNEIERGLREGLVRTVVATNALELGIDIGGMGASVMTGYPGSVAGTWQQAGRAGRKREPSLAALISSANPLDQFLAHHPDYFFKRSPEQALINPDNLLILLQHLRCATFELPFRKGDHFGRVESDQVEELLQFLQASGEIHASGETYFWMADRYPAEKVTLRSASSDRVDLEAAEENSWKTIGHVDITSAPWMVHPQAIYLHEGLAYSVEDLDLTRNVARLRPCEVDYYTEPRTESTVSLLEISRDAPAFGATRFHGEIAVTTRVAGFQKIKWFTHEILGGGELSLPPTRLQTTGYWLSLTDQTVEGLRMEGLWTNDPNDYGPNWPLQREKARERDRFLCQICGGTEVDVSHHVHHKIPFRTFAAYEQANRLTNLVTLCSVCHRRAEQAVRIRSGLAGMAYILGNLAPLFLMCDARDIGVHFDPQSPLGEGRPTVVIYDLVPAGIGFSEHLFERHQELIARAHDLVGSCECVDGCPSCVGPAGENGENGKRETQGILGALQTTL